METARPNTAMYRISASRINGRVYSTWMPMQRPQFPVTRFLHARFTSLRACAVNSPFIVSLLPLSGIYDAASSVCADCSTPTETTSSRLL